MQIDDNSRESAKFSRKLPILIILGLLIIRIPILVIINLYINPTPEWLVITVETSVYFFIAILIYIEKNNLYQFHIDKISIALFIIFGTVLRTNTFNNSHLNIFLSIFWIIALCLLLALRKDFSKIPAIKNKDYIWFIIGASIAILLSIIVTMPGILQIKDNYSEPFPNVMVLTLSGILGLMHEMSHSSIFEEPIFRGFLWGYLRNLGLKENYVWIIQAILFWIAHINYIDKPFTFYFTVPLMGLVLGLLAWKSRSISTSMLTHAIYNSAKY